MPSTARSKRKGFVKAWEPTEEQRKTVKTMTAYGINQNDICLTLDITVPTLHKYFRRELDTGAPEANAQVIESLFLNATKGKNVAAQIFWAKCRAGWREPRQFDEELTVETSIRIEGGLPDE